MAKLSHLNPLSQIMVLLGTILVSLGLFSILSVILVPVLFGLDIVTNPSVINDLTNPAVLPALKFMQTIQAMAVFIIPPLVVALLVDNKPFSFLKANRGIPAFNYVLVIVVMLASLPLINWMAELNGKLSLPGFLAGVEKWMRDSEDNAARLTKAFLQMDTFTSFLFNMFMIALIPAIGEELLFRGAMQSLFKRMFKNHHIAILVTAILFSAMHMQFYGFIPRMMMGLLFGYLVYWFDSLWPAIVAHFANNGAAVVMSYLAGNGYISADMENAGTGNDAWIYVIVSLVLVGSLVYVLKRNASAKIVSGYES